MNLTSAERARFQSKYKVSKGGCWVWQGPLDRDGYGTFYLRRRNRRAHRVAWFDIRGEIPEGCVINHFCQNRACVNPQHLNIVTAEENVFLNSRSAPAINRQKTHCKNGHPFDRTIIGSNGKPTRICSICYKERKRKMRARWAAENTLSV